MGWIPHEGHASLRTGVLHQSSKSIIDLNRASRLFICRTTPGVFKKTCAVRKIRRMCCGDLTNRLSGMGDMPTQSARGDVKWPGIERVLRRKASPLPTFGGETQWSPNVGDRIAVAVESFLKASCKATERYADSRPPSLFLTDCFFN